MAAKKRPGTGDVSVLVTVAPENAGKMRTITAGLKKAGLQVEESMSDVGIIVGSVPQSKLARLEAVDGVRAVERQNTVQLPPPDAPVQ